MVSTYLLHYCVGVMLADLWGIVVMSTQQHIEEILDAIWGHVDEQDHHDIKWILCKGFPPKLIQFTWGKTIWRCWDERTAPQWKGTERMYLKQWILKKGTVRWSLLAQSFVIFWYLHIMSPRQGKDRNQMSLDSAGIDPRSITPKTGQWMMMWTWRRNHLSLLEM